MWEPEKIKLFISHKADYKKYVKYLSDVLSERNITCFVAHEDIEPTKEWQDEIEKALWTMDAFLAYLTDDFQGGNWTSQEIGFAVAREVPIIPLKLQNLDPYGFIGKIQAVPRTDDVYALATKIADILVKKLENEGHIREIIINSFIKSYSYEVSTNNFEQLKAIDSFSNDELDEMAKAYNENNQLYDNRVLYNGKFANFLNSKSDNKFEYANNKITKKLF